MPKVIKPDLKIEPWALKVLHYEFSGGFMIGLIFNQFPIDKKSAGNPIFALRFGARLAREVFWQRVGGRGGLRWSFWFEFAENERRFDTPQHPALPRRGRQIRMRLAARALAPPSLEFEGLVQLMAIQKSQVKDCSFDCFGIELTQFVCMFLQVSVFILSACS